MDLLFSIRDLGLPEPLPDSIDVAVRAALTHAIQGDASAPARGFRPLRHLVRRGTVVPAALVLTTAAAAAATGLVSLPSAQKFARHNVSDSALTLFRKSVPYEGGTMADGTLVPYTETVIPSSVRMIAKLTVPGVGAVQFWVGDTKQHGYCTALRLPGGAWAGLEDQSGAAGPIPGCQPTRRQIGWGTLILSGFDYNDVGVVTSGGEERSLIYGQVVVPGHPTQVRDENSGATSSVLDGKYFMLDETPDAASDTHLVALNASGKIIADEHKPLPGTPTVKCIGRYDVRRNLIPGTKRTDLTWDCRHYVRVIAK